MIKQEERSIVEEVVFSQETGFPIFQEEGDNYLWTPTEKEYRFEQWQYRNLIDLIKDVYDAKQIIMIAPGIKDGIVVLHTIIEHSDGHWQGIKTQFSMAEYEDFSDELIVSHIIGHPLTINEL